MKTLFLALLLCGCSATTNTPPQTQTCEQQFNAALEANVPYTEALGNYTQCLIERGDTA